MNELIINLKGVYRTASATPGLLITSVKDTVTYFFLYFCPNRLAFGEYDHVQNKKIHAEGSLSTKEIHPPVSGTHFVFAMTKKIIPEFFRKKEIPEKYIYKRTSETKFIPGF